jgi:hypothetical protein
MSTISEQEYQQRIAALERQSATLAAEVDRQRERERALSAAYLRLRQLIGQRAFDTPPAPTAEQVWAVTENALIELTTQLNQMRPVVDAAIEWERYRYGKPDNDELLQVVNDYEEQMAALEKGGG